MSKGEQKKPPYNKVHVAEQSPPLKQRKSNDWKPRGANGPEGAQEISAEPDDTKEVPQAAVRMDDSASALSKSLRAFSIN